MVAPVANVPGVNPVTSQIPGFIQQQLQAQRTAQMAAALSEQGQQPLQYDNRGRVGWGQSLAKLLQTGFGTYLGNQSVGQQAGLQQQGMQAMAQALGMGQPSPAQSALGSGAAQGSVGPTNDNAARLAAALGPAQKQNVDGAVTPTSMNPMGLPPMLLMSAQGGDPMAKAQLDTLLKNLEMTGETKNSMYMGQTPQQMLANTQGKALKEAQIEYKPGEFTFNPISGQGGFFPSLPANTQPTGPVGPSGHVGGISLVPGAPQALQVTSQAGATGTTAGSAHTVVNPDGSSSTGLGMDLFHIPPAVQASRNVDQLSILKDERAKRTNSPEDNMALDREIARVSGGRVATGPSTTDAAVQKTSGDAIAVLPQQVEKSKQAIAGLEGALHVLDGVKATGPGTAKSVNWAALLNNVGIPLGKSNVDNYQLAQKYLANSLNAAAAGTGSSGSDARFDSFSHGQPNPDTMDKAPLESAVRYVLSQHDAAIARGKFVQDAYSQAKAAGDPNAAQTAQQQWSQSYNPQVFAFSRMTPSERQQFKASMPPAQQQAFGQQYNAAHERGWVQ